MYVRYSTLIHTFFPPSKEDKEKIKVENQITAKHNSTGQWSEP